MLVNKYTLRRRLTYKLYNAVPAARILKQAAVPLKVRKLRRLVEARKAELAAAEKAEGRHPLFSYIEIETFSRCNGECGFCPVNRHIDPRPPLRMKEELFRSIIDQLHDLDYRGGVYPYSNNEPFLDTRIFDFTAYARERLPKAMIFLYSNGLLLTPEKYRRIIPLVDNFTINNYCDDFTLADNVREIHEIAEADPELRRKTMVVMRYRREIMTSRGGQSPNKLDILPRTLPVGCLLPARQMVVRPDGRLSLCCNDALGKMTLGDLTSQTLEEAWRSEQYTELRRKILEGRGALDLCRHCDTLHF